MADEKTIEQIVNNQINEVLSKNFFNNVGTALVNNLNVLEPIIQADNAVREFARNTKITSERFFEVKGAILETRDKILLMGGDFSEALGIQKEYMQAVQTNTSLNSEFAKDLFAIEKSLGQDAKMVVENFANAGFNMKSTTESMQTALDVSRRIGVNAEMVAANVVDHIEKMNMFTFQGGVEGLAKMAAQAVNLRFNMQNTLTLAEKLFDPEQAIDMAAAMQRLGVTQSDLLDPLRLMDLAQNDPAELQNQLVKMSEQFVQLNAKGQFEIMPGARRQLMEISKALGMNYDDITKMALGSADLGRKMREISFPKDAITDEQRQLIANMATLNKEGTGYVVKVKVKDEEGTVTEQEKMVSELSTEDLESLKEASQPKSLEEVAKDQLKIAENQEASLRSIDTKIGTALAGTKIGEDTVEVMKIFSKTLGDVSKVFNQEDLVKTLNISGDKIYNVLDDIFKSFEGDENITNLTTSLSKLGETAEEYFGEKGKNVFTAIETDMTNFYGSGNKFAEIIKKIVGVIDKTAIEPEEKQTNPTTPTTTVKTNDVLIQTLPEDTLRHVNGNVTIAGTNLDGDRNNFDPSMLKSMFEKQNNSASPMTNEVKMTLTMDLNINSNSPNIDTNQLKIALNNSNLIREMVGQIEVASKNMVTDAMNRNSPYNYTPSYGSYT